MTNALANKVLIPGRTLRIRVAMAEHKTWWRNFEQEHPLCLRLAGKDYEATGRVVRENGLVNVVAALEDGSQPATGRLAQGLSEGAQRGSCSWA